MRKKGQAAMEFLMTYGWAILAAVIVIGVLASFGVFSSESYIPTQCTIAAPFGCDGNQVSANTTGIQFVARNGGGQSFNVTNVEVDGCGNYTTNFTMTDQDTELIYVACSGGLTADSKFSGGVTITYRTLNGILDQTTTGDITVEVGA